LPKKKKLNNNMSKIFNSTHKNFNNSNKNWLEKPSKKKIRPNSAQNVDNNGNIVYDMSSPGAPNEDLDTPIKTINELAEGPVTVRDSDTSNVIEEIKNPSRFMIQSLEDDYETPPQDTYRDDYGIGPDSFCPTYEQMGVDPPISNITKKRTSKSKERKAKNAKEQEANTFGLNKLLLSRPFSGDPNKPSKLIKGPFKTTNIKARPKTAKKVDKKFEQELKSPGSKRLLSPKTNKKPAKKSKTRQPKFSKGVKKGQFNKMNRKASMSPSNENPKDLMSIKGNKPGKNLTKQTFGNRRSMNDLRGKNTPNYEFQFIDTNQAKPINVLTNNFLQNEIKDDQVEIIQKCIRGYKARKQVELLKSEKANAIRAKPKIKPAAQTNPDALRLNKVNSESSNTLERATNQVDILTAMVINNDGEYEKKPRDTKLKANLKNDIQPKLTLLKKKSRDSYNKHHDDILSKSVSNIDPGQGNDQTSEQKLKIGNSQLKIRVKKRPNSAKNKVKLEECDVKLNAESSKKLKEIFSKFQSFKNSKKDDLEDAKSNISKPPISGRLPRNDKNAINHKSNDSLSDRFSQLSPAGVNLRRKYINHY
jgi:hypothetical protein